LTAAIVIPSCKPLNYGPCVESILKNQPGITPDKIIVVLDGCEKLGFPVTYIEGVKPFIFARNVNLGIKQAAGDVILLNDDTELVTRNGFTLLSQSERTGITSAKIDGAGYWRADKFCAFVAVFIPKEVFDKVGLLDERFIRYGFEDTDYCDRLRAAHMSISRLDDCVVKHYHPSRSSFHGPNGNYRGDNLVIYDQKYGIKREYTWPEHWEQLAELTKA
jgi:N-terminal domain of galactosyltransferase